MTPNVAPKMTPTLLITPKNYPNTVPTNDTKHTFQCFSHLEMAQKVTPQMTPQMLITPRNDLNNDINHDFQCFSPLEVTQNVAPK